MYINEVISVVFSLSSVKNLEIISFVVHLLAIRSSDCEHLTTLVIQSLFFVCVPAT